MQYIHRSPSYKETDDKNWANLTIKKKKVNRRSKDSTYIFTSSLST